MPNYDDSRFDDWYEAEEDMWDEILDNHPELDNDRQAELYYHLGYFSHDLDPRDRQLMSDALINYLSDNFDIDWDQEFDWEAYRAWYEGQE